MNEEYGINETGDYAGGSDRKDTADPGAEDVKGMIDREQTILLQKMIERQDHDIRLTRIIAFVECALLIGLIMVFGLLVPKFLRTVKTVDESMAKVNTFLESTEKTLGAMKTLAEDTDAVLIANDEAVGKAIENFNSVDFESLNHSIASIAEIIKPVVEIVKIFK